MIMGSTARTPSGAGRVTTRSTGCGAPTTSWAEPVTTRLRDLEAYGDAYGDADIIYGQAGNDTLYGHGGLDQMFGDGVAAYSAGSSLYGLEGTDKLYGGTAWTCCRVA